MNEKSLANLKSYKPGEKRASENGKKGAKKTAEIRREKKRVAEVVSLMLRSSTNAKTQKAITKICSDVDTDDIDVLASMVAGQIQSATQGNTKAFEKLLEILEQTEKKEKVVYKIPADDMSTNFIDVNHDINDRGHFEYWLHGGRGSNKSTFVSEKINELLQNNPKMCAIVIRRVGNTLKDSVYSQIQWAIEHSGQEHLYKFTKSPLEITLKATGQKIYFRGADEPQKIKSIKPPNGKYIGIIWYEEADQMQGIEAMRTIDQSVIRGGDDFVKFVTYNTPRSQLHWINTEASKFKADRLVHLSDYTGVPKKWLGQQFIDDAEWLKETNEKAYQNEYLGLAVGQGTEVFDNLESREITADEIKTFNHFYYGVDWGWFPDPWQYVKCSYDSNRHTLYIIDECRANKKRPIESAEILKEQKGITDELLICDSASPESIADYKVYGFNVRGSEKGWHSVKYGMRWLQGLNKIIIDSRKCPNVWKEFSQYQYELTKDGEPISEYPDKDNHSIDAVRYAMERVWKVRGR